MLWTDRVYEQEAVGSWSEARAFLERGLYAESVKMSRSAMEKGAKSLLMSCVGKYPTVHLLAEEDFVDALNRLRSIGPPIIEDKVVRMCGQAMVVSNMWATIHTVVEYGIRPAMLQPSDLFGEGEAKRALDDAALCIAAVTMAALGVEEHEAGDE